MVISFNIPPIRKEAIKITSIQPILDIPEDFIKSKRWQASITVRYGHIKSAPGSGADTIYKNLVCQGIWL